MNGKQWLTRLAPFLIALVAVMVMAAPSFAAVVDVYLVARAFNKTVAGVSVPMWGFAEDADSNLATVGTEVPTVPGPRLTVHPGGTLRIHLRNDLSGAGAEPVSIIIPGQAMPTSPSCSGPVWTDGTSGARTSADQRVRSFGCEAAPGGGTQAYEWSSL